MTAAATSSGTVCAKGELVAERAESKRWLRRGEEPYSCTVTTPDEASAPLSAGSDGRIFRRAFETRILPALEAFAPDLLLVSAGFDAHRADPLAGLELEEADFAWVTARLMEAARRHCDGKLVSVLVGGYDLRTLAGSGAAHLSVLVVKA